MLNLFTTGWLMRRYGPRRAMVMQTAIPCVRNLAQTYAGKDLKAEDADHLVKPRLRLPRLPRLTTTVLDGGILGIRILQWTQLLTIFGGGAVRRQDVGLYLRPER